MKKITFLVFICMVLIYNLYGQIPSTIFGEYTGTANVTVTNLGIEENYSNITVELKNSNDNYSLEIAALDLGEGLIIPPYEFGNVTITPSNNNYILSAPDLNIIIPEITIPGLGPLYNVPVTISIGSGSQVSGNRLTVNLLAILKLFGGFYNVPVNIHFTGTMQQSSEYDPLAVQCINNLITNNGLIATPNAPETWNFAVWNDEIPKQIIALYLENKNLTGAAFFTGLTKLNYLNCSYNDLTELNITNNPAMEYLECAFNGLSELDVSNNILLQYLSFGNNDLTELDITNNTALQHLSCFYNRLTELDVTNNIAIKHLTCAFNSITQLDITNNTALTRLDCCYTILTELDITNNLSLQYLNCEYTYLTELNVTNNTYLTELSCGYNSLTELDVSNNIALQSLNCYYNMITELDVSNNIALQSLNCYNNRLTGINLTGLINLSNFNASYQNVSLTLEKNEEGEYACQIFLKNPIFGSNAISYLDGILKSKSYSVSSTNFVVETGKFGYSLSGTMYFTYKEVGIFNNTYDFIDFIIYPNPTTGQLKIKNYKLKGIEKIEIFDVFGRVVHSCLRAFAPSCNEIVLDISHLPKGVYTANVTSNGKVIGTNKIVKK